MKITKYLCYIIILFILIGTTACTNSPNTEKTDSSNNQSENKGNAPITIEGDTYPLSITDALGKETILESKPERVAVISGTPLNIWYSLGGKSICSADISENLKIIEGAEEEIKNLSTVGPLYSIDVEALVAHEPDLIITQLGPQNVYTETLREMGYPVICMRTSSYRDLLLTYDAFGKILEEESKAEEIIAGLKNQKENIREKLPEEEKSVVILYVTAKSLAVKLDSSIAGDIANILNLKNIASNLPPDTIGSESTPLDIEYIVEKNPDYVLVTSMIDSNEAAKETMEKEFAENPVWQGVKAIEEDRVIFLPQQYFLYNAGPYYGEAIEYMAQSIYPDIYGKAAVENE